MRPLSPIAAGAGRAARWYLRVRGAARADPRGSGVGLVPRPQALLMPTAALFKKATAGGNFNLLA
jgi:hypothetical protein